MCLASSQLYLCKTFSECSSIFRAFFRNCFAQCDYLFDFYSHPLDNRGKDEASGVALCYEFQLTQKKGTIALRIECVCTEFSELEETDVVTSSAGQFEEIGMVHSEEGQKILLKVKRFFKEQAEMAWAATLHGEE